MVKIDDRDLKHLVSYLDGRYVRMYPAANLFLAWDVEGGYTFDVYALDSFWNFESFGVEPFPKNTDEADRHMDEWVDYYMGKR